MSTRALIKFIDCGDNHLVTLYNHYDGYPAGLGADLKAFIKSGKRVNGYSSDDEGVVWNGFGCFVASLIKEFKPGTGGLYVYPHEPGDCWQEYEYTIKETIDKKIMITCYDVDIKGNLDNFTEVI